MSVSTPDELVAAARRAAHTRTAQVVLGPTPGSMRVYLPTYGRFFEAPSVTWLMAASEIIALAEELARRGEYDQASAAADYALTLRLSRHLRLKARRVHDETHAHRCCVVHGTHATTHRGCVLR
ncbi:hypothetical protein [Pseudactinotalea terrae]|uniref:hypothetical protein n=1 Tax=Pseudactinotalea terrae TaxID=1743262 RepID=UPI0012E0F364|nr:hypothetical protein [Pseudactinotalea terrae]